METLEGKANQESKSQTLVLIPQCLNFPSELRQHPPKIPQFGQRPSTGTKQICLSTPCETSQCPKG